MPKQAAALRLRHMHVFAWLAAKKSVAFCCQVAERARAVWAEKHPHLLSRTTIVGGSFLDPGAQQCCSAETCCPEPLLERCDLGL